MQLINQITSDALQTQNLILPDNSTVTLEINFRPMQYGWFFNNITWNTFILNGLRITNSPNMLLQFQNQLTFGIACFSTANREPSLQQDFQSGHSQLFILDQAEVQEYYKFLQTGVF